MRGMDGCGYAEMSKNYRLRMNTGQVSEKFEFEKHTAC
jgi:hypothetical protein